jgi:hypothetical protein
MPDSRKYWRIMGLIRVWVYRTQPRRLSVMTNRNRAWRRRQRVRILSKVKTTREWATDQVGKTMAAVQNATNQTMKLHVGAKRKLAGQAQFMREAWRLNQDFTEEHFREVPAPAIPAA